jgi:HlyD family secretion protein
VQNVVTYDVVVGVDNADFALKPGMTASVTITTARQDDALRLPVRALRFKPEASGPPEKAASTDGGRPGKREPDAPAVYVLGPDGNPKRVEVKTGLRTDRHAELLGGELAVGDAVIVAAKRAEAQPAQQQSPFAPPRMR